MSRIDEKTSGAVAIALTAARAASNSSRRTRRPNGNSSVMSTSGGLLRSVSSSMRMRVCMNSAADGTSVAVEQAGEAGAVGSHGRKLDEIDAGQVEMPGRHATRDELRRSPASRKARARIERAAEMPGAEKVRDENGDAFHELPAWIRRTGSLSWESAAVVMDVDPVEAVPLHPEWCRAVEIPAGRAGKQDTHDPDMGNDNRGSLDRTKPRLDPLPNASWRFSPRRLKIPSPFLDMAIARIGVRQQVDARAALPSGPSPSRSALARLTGSRPPTMRAVSTARASGLEKSAAP